MELKITLKGYADNGTGEVKKIRKVTITGHGKIKPALIIINDKDLPVEQIIRKNTAEDGWWRKVLANRLNFSI